MHTQENKEVRFLEGEHIFLRPIGLADSELYYRTLFDPDVRRLTGTQSYFTREQINRYIENKSKDSSSILLLISLFEPEEVIGDIALQDIDPVNRSANLRLAINHGEHQGKGYGSEAIKLMLEYGFGVLHLHRIELNVYSYNERAKHVYAKLGFKEEGIQRDVLYYDHAYHDSIMMSMLEEEYREMYVLGQTVKKGS